MSDLREWVVTDYAKGYKSLVLRPCEAQEPGPGDIRLRVEAFALNWGDMDLMRGIYSFNFESLPARVGIEAVGIVDQVGRGVEGIAVGDRYCTLPYFYYQRGTSADSVTIPARYATRAPDGLSAVESASIWMAYMTAYYPIAALTGDGPDRHILVTAGTSTAGNAALNIGRLCGANMLTTTRFEANEAYLRASGADHVFASSRDDSLTDFIDRATDGAGVEIIFDCVAGDMMTQYATRMARDARIYYYGLLGGAFPTELPLVGMFQANASFHPYSVFNYVQHETLCRQGCDYIYDAFAIGKLSANVDRVFPMEGYIEAWDYMRTERASHGKIVIETGLS
ncbi:MAG: zinc-binding dehydrogenase [Pseudomonadota bacterium]